MSFFPDVCNARSGLILCLILSQMLSFASRSVIQRPLLSRNWSFNIFKAMQRVIHSRWLNSASIKHVSLTLLTMWVSPLGVLYAHMINFWHTLDIHKCWEQTHESGKHFKIVDCNENLPYANPLKKETFWNAQNSTLSH